MSTHEDLQRIVDGGVVAVMRGTESGKVEDVAEALTAGGVTALEITMNTPDALEGIETLSSLYEGEDVLVGAGTVLDGETARAALLAGAEFIVCPNFDPDVVEVSNRYGAVVAPGVATPTEMVNAYEAGADVVKLFPASDLGPGYLSSVMGPLDHVPVVPTGGIGPHNAAEFVEAGAIAVGAGGSLLDDEAIAAGNFDVIQQNAEELVGVVQDARS